MHVAPVQEELLAAKKEPPVEVKAWTAASKPLLSGVSTASLEAQVPDVSVTVNDASMTAAEKPLGLLT